VTESRNADRTYESPAAVRAARSAVPTGRLEQALPKDDGSPLDGQTRSQAESRLGHDFSKVRVHSDAAAAVASHDFGAAAYTIGKHIVFGAGQYRPESPAGGRLLAHELAHVVQGAQAGTARLPLVSDPGDPAEHEADAVAETIGRGRRATPLGRPAAVIQRTPETWYRGEAVGVGPAKPGAHLHDFGDGLYLTDSPQVAGQYAVTRAGDKPLTARTLSVTMEPERLGRVLDLTKDTRWQAFLKSRATPQSLTNEELIRLANENYAPLFEDFVKVNKIPLDTYDAVKGPEFVRGGTQLCIKNPAYQADVRAALTDVASVVAGPTEGVGRGQGSAKLVVPGESAEGKLATPKVPTEMGVPKLPVGKTVPKVGELGALEGTVARGPGAVRRLALGAAESVAEGALSIVGLLVVVVWELVVAPYLAKLQREAEEKYRKVLQSQIQAYYDAHLAGTIEQSLRRLGRVIKMIEDEKKQPYANVTLTVHFDLSLIKRLLSGPGMPDSIVNLDFRSMEVTDISIDRAPVAERAEPLKGDNATWFLDDATEFSQVLHFAVIPPSYQELVAKFGADRVGTGCFIATACYGSALAPEVDVLRRYRDRVLMTSPAGRSFVAWYYRHSPAVAAYLTRHQIARKLVRIGLVVPAVAVARLDDRRSR
jgi:hypothetical protein